MMAGDVKVKFDGGDLDVTGDDNDNQVHVFQANGFVVVAGLNGTKINGKTGAYAFAYGKVKEDVFIKLKGGDDTLFVGGVDCDMQPVPYTEENGEECECERLFCIQDLYPNSTGGAALVNGDTVLDTLARKIGPLNFQDLNVRENLSINTTGNTKWGDEDHVVLQSVTVGEDLDIVTGAKDDCVLGTDLDLREDAKIDTGDHDDVVSLTCFEVGGHGDSGDLEILTGKGHDKVDLFCGFVDEDLTVKTGDGHDFVLIEDVEVDEDADIDTGNGDDKVVLIDVDVARNFAVKGGSGSDLIEYDSQSRPDTLSSISKTDSIALEEFFRAIDECLFDALQEAGVEG